MRDFRDSKTQIKKKNDLKIVYIKTWFYPGYTVPIF